MATAELQASTAKSVAFALAVLTAAAPLGAQSRRLADISTVVYDDPLNLVFIAAPVGGQLVFAVSVGTDDAVLYKTDGTAAGTSLIANVSPGVSQGIGEMVSTGTVAYFSATDEAGGSELWRTDATAGGTFRILDIQPGPSSGLPNYLTVMGSTLFFSANDGLHGTELWRSDGTPGGTSMVKDICPGPEGSFPQELVVIGGTFYFSANDCTNGEELWKSLGAEGNTELVTNIA